MGEIQYKRSAHNAAELMGVLSNLAQVRLYSSYRHKWDYIYTCTATTRHFASKDLGNISVTCHKIHHFHPCSNSSKARVITGHTTVTDGGWCTEKGDNRLPWRGVWIVERLRHAHFSYFIILYSCPTDPNTEWRIQEPVISLVPVNYHFIHQ
jgi:hypothetical protein